MSLEHISDVRGEKVPELGGRATPAQPPAEAGRQRMEEEDLRELETDMEGRGYEGIGRCRGGV